MPYAIGAKFAHPDRPVIALVGDGAMQMNGMAELLTIERYRDRWTDQRLIVCVFHNNDLNQVTWELRAMGGAPKFEESQALPDVSYADFARAIGLHGITVRRSRTSSARRGSRRSPPTGPTVLDVRCDPEVPPIPPHATFDQAMSMVESVLGGDPSAMHLMVQGAKEKLQEILPAATAENPGLSGHRAATSGMSDSATPPGSSTIDSSNLRSIDRRITSLRVRIRTMSPRSAALVPAYRDEIDRLSTCASRLMRADRPRLHAV